MTIPELMPVPGLTARPLVRSDSRAVFEVMAAAELAELGTVEIEESDIVSDWSRPSCDLSATTMGVFDGDRMVGYVELTGPDRSDGAVHPDYQRRGLGTVLRRWVEAVARGQGSALVGTPVPAGGVADRLLAKLGYFVRWNSWVLELPAGAEIESRALPPGYRVRAALPQDYPAVHAVLEDAFLEWSDREREPYADFVGALEGRPGFAPWQVRVVTDAGGQVVAAATLSWIEPDEHRSPGVYVLRLGVRRDQRNQGLAQALLVDAFAVGRAHGAETCALSTDSRTGALSLYEKVGMVVVQDWVHRAIQLGGAAETAESEGDDG